MVLMMFNLLKTYEQIVWVLFGPNTYVGYYFLFSDSYQVFWRKVWLSETSKFCRWVQEEDNAFLKLKIGIRAEAGPTNCPHP